MEQKHKLFER